MKKLIFIISFLSILFCDLNAQAQSTICFDKKYVYYANIRNRESIGCFYISTSTGYVAQIFSDEECRNGLNNYHNGYKVAIISQQGEAFLYQIDDKGRKTFMPFLGTNVDRSQPTLNKVNPSAPGYALTLTNLNLGVRAYENTGISNSKIYLHATILPRNINIRRYLGVFGLGIYKSADNKEYKALAVEYDDVYVRVDNIENVNECFRPSDFSVNVIEESAEIEDEIIEKKENNISYKERNINNSACVEEQQALINFDKIVLEKSKRSNDYNKRNPVVDINTNNATKKMLLDAADPKDMTTKTKLEIELKICRLYDQIYRNQNSGNQSPRLQNNYSNKIECLNVARDKLIFLENELSNLDNRYASNPAQAHLEKSKLYFRRMGEMNTNCNTDRDGNIIDNSRSDSPAMNELREQIRNSINNR
ncbi:MAG: hypothetical protein KA275_01640 [Chitinophagaceae bacterium]|nr:hypothetical protein [Chitinophagaceae bacterium]